MLTAREFRAISEWHQDREEGEWLRCASIQATLANCNRDASKRPEPFSPYDFLSPEMDRRGPAREPTQEEVMRDMRLLNASFGGVDLTTKQNG